MTANPDDPLAEKDLLRATGTMFTTRALEKGEELHLQAVDADGVVVANGFGRIVMVTVKDWLDRDGVPTGTDRVANVKVT